MDFKIDNCVRFCLKHADLFSTISSLFGIEKHLNGSTKEIKKYHIESLSIRFTYLSTARPKDEQNNTV